MKIWNKIICLALVAVISFSLVACSVSNATPNNNGASDGNDSTGVSKITDTDTTKQEAGTGNGEAGDDVTFEDVTKYDTTLSDVSMESGTDSFTLMDKAYAADESFVYTAMVSFEGGVAAGLAFGAEDGSHYWVFNVDRQANLVKLLYFTVKDGKTSATELLTDYFIGNDKMTDSEKRLVGSKVAGIEKVQLKVVITPEEDGVYAEFYADNIRRFGIDNTIELNSLEKLPENVAYAGGSIGFNCFNSKVKFDNCPSISMIFLSYCFNTTATFLRICSASGNISALPESKSIAPLKFNMTYCSSKSISTAFEIPSWSTAS